MELSQGRTSSIPPGPRARFRALACLLSVATFVLFCVATRAATSAISGTGAPLGLPSVPTRDIPPAVASLGKRLFFDKRLSLDGTISCASCHIPEKALSDGLPVGRGIRGQSGTRNTPSLWNVAFATSLFWDGRRATLEQQAADPLLNPREHGFPDTDALLAVLRGNEAYRRDFRAAFGIESGQIALTHAVAALAAFERTLLAADSPFDRYVYGGDGKALSAEAIRGLALFRGRAQCATCHLIGEHGALLTDNLYHSVGVGLKQVQPHLALATTRIASETSAVLDQLIGADAEVAALGRFVVTKQPHDIGSFRTPSLRNVALTAPYMHDGSTATLEEALDIELYYRSVELQKPLILTPAEKADLLEFLRSLTSPTATSIR